MVIDSIECTCAVCGKKIYMHDSERNGRIPYLALDMLNPERLDFRPHASVLAGRFIHDLQQCPHCGYVAPNLSLKRFGMDVVVCSAEYVDKYNQEDTVHEYDPETEMVLQEAYAFVLEQSAHLSPDKESTELQYQLLHAYLDAAWFFDEEVDFWPDSKILESKSVMYRQKAADVFERISDWPGYSYDLLMIDVYRRLSMWDKAKTLLDRSISSFTVTETVDLYDCEEYDRKTISDTLLKLQELIAQKDSVSHDDNHYEPIA